MNFSMNFNQESKSITTDMISLNIETDLSNLIDLRRQNISKPMMRYLNINNLKNKIDYLRDICNKSPVDNFFVLTKPKLILHFPTASFFLMVTYFHRYEKIVIKMVKGKFYIYKGGY